MCVLLQSLIYIPIGKGLQRVTKAVSTRFVEVPCTNFIASIYFFCGELFLMIINFKNNGEGRKKQEKYCPIIIIIFDTRNI